MKTQLFALTAALVLLSTSAFAQLTSTPLEPGLYPWMKGLVPGVALINDKTMTVGGATRVEYVSAEQITVSGVVATVVASTPTLDRVRRMVDEYNRSAVVGTLKFDENTGSVSMQCFINPRLTSLPAITFVVVYFDATLREQASRFADSFAQRMR